MSSKIDTSLNYFLYTANFHATDMSSYDEYYKWLKVKINDISKQYWLNTEYSNTTEEHLHAVISFEKCKANEKDKILNKLFPKSQKKILKHIINTNENAFNIKPLNDCIDIYSSIGYIIKQGKDNLYTNERDDKFLDDCYKSHIYKSKKPIAPLPHVEPYKILSVGNVRDYIIHHAKENPQMPLHVIPDYLVKHQSVSFIKISKYQKEVALREAHLILAENDEEHYFMSDYDTPKFYMENELISQQTETINTLEMELDKQKTQTLLLKNQIKELKKQLKQK